MKNLLDALVSQGMEVEFECKNGHFPFNLKTHRLKGGQIEIDSNASSQFLSALLMIAPFAMKDITIETKGYRVRQAYVSLTNKMMNCWGQSISSDNGYQKTKIKANPNYHYDSGHYNIEPDIITFAKGITSGYLPLSGIGVGKKVSDVGPLEFQKGEKDIKVPLANKILSLKGTTMVFFGEDFITVKKEKNLNKLRLLNINGYAGIGFFTAKKNGPTIS